MKVLYWIFLILILASSVDCLLYGLLGIDLIVRFFPDVVTTATDGTTTTAMAMGAKVLYALFGIAGLWVVIANLVGCKKCCQAPQA